MKIIPVYREVAAKRFIDRRHYTPTTVVEEGEEILTAPLKIGEKLSLLGISQTQPLLECGLQDTTDSIDPFIVLKAIYLGMVHFVEESGQEIPITIKVDTLNLVMANFTYGSEDNYRRVSLTLPLTFTLNKDTVRVDPEHEGVKLFPPDMIDDLNVRFHIHLIGSVNLELADTCVYSSEMVLDADQLTEQIAAEGVYEKVDVDAYVQDFKEFFLGIRVIGYDLEAKRVNYNRQQREEAEAKAKQPQAAKKHPQFILAADNSYFDLHNAQHNACLVSDFKAGVTKFPMDQFISEVQSFLIIKEREVLEKDPTYRQLIPYLIVTQEGDDGVERFIPYQRMKGVGESRLAGKVSVGFGGHIDLEDVVCNHNAIQSVVDLARTIVDAADREFSEEIEISYPTNIDLTKIPFPSIEATGEFILLNHDVHAVHVGIVMRVKLSPHAIVSSGEEELKLLPAMTARELLNNALEGDEYPDANSTRYDLEEWTRVYLEASLLT